MLKDDPSDPVANYLMADKMISNGLEGEVKIYLEKTISIDPSNEKGYTDDAKFMLAYIKEDPLTIESLIKEYPSSEKVKDGYINLASYYAEKEDYAKTEKFYSEAFAKFGKNDEDLVLNYGSMLLNKGYAVMKNENATDQDRKDAIQTLIVCLDYVKGSVNEASAYYIMSDLYFQNKDVVKANECIDKSIEIYDKKSYRDQKLKINGQEASSK
jgi:tetratricopeptide (TPR) repeat protein